MKKEMNEAIEEIRRLEKDYYAGLITGEELADKQIDALIRMYNKIRRCQ